MPQLIATPDEVARMTPAQRTRARRTAVAAALRAAEALERADERARARQAARAAEAALVRDEARALAETPTRKPRAVDADVARCGGCGGWVWRRRACGTCS